MTHGSHAYDERYFEPRRSDDSDGPHIVPWDAIVEAITSPPWGAAYSIGRSVSLAGHAGGRATTTGHVGKRAKRGHPVVNTERANRHNFDMVANCYLYLTDQQGFPATQDQVRRELGLAEITVRRFCRRVEVYEWPPV